LLGHVVDNHDTTHEFAFFFFSRFGADTGLPEHGTGPGYVAFVVKTHKVRGMRGADLDAVCKLLGKPGASVYFLKKVVLILREWSAVKEIEN
jgi:hypothetical protein